MCGWPPQPTTHVRHGRRTKAFEDRPKNIFLGRTHPLADKQTGQVGVQELWLNPTLPPEQLRELRGINRWTPARMRQAFRK